MTRPICVPKNIIIFPEMGSVIKYNEYHDDTDTVVKVAIMYSPAIPSGKDFLIFKGEPDMAISIFQFLAHKLNAIFVDQLDKS